MTISPSARSVWRNYVTDGVPSSGNHPVKKSECRNWGTAVESAIDAYSSGAGSIAKSTRALLYADLAHAADVMAWVYADSTAAYNGIYRKSLGTGTGSWTRILDLPYSFVVGSDTGAGTANAIQITTDIPVSDGMIVAFGLFEATTSSPVTVSINGGTPLTLKTNRGNNASGLSADMEIWGRVRTDDTTFSLLNDQDVSALVAQAETARDEAVAAASTAIGVPQYDDYAEAGLVTVPAYLNQTMVAGRLHYRVAADPHTKSAYQDASGAWFSAVTLRNTGPVEVWVAWGQSEMRAVTGSPGNIGGDRVARSNVLSYVRGTTIAGVADGWYAVGPEDDAWPFASSVSAVGSPFYLSAAKRAEEIGGTVCIVPYALGGQESGAFIQGGGMWVGLQASWSDALAAALPGRGGQTLNDLGKTLADVMLIWQGSADADYKLGTGDAATDADDWVLRWRTILNSLQSPSGVSVPITRADLTKIIFFEMLHGATSGGAPGIGDPTDSRNADLHKLWKYTSGKREQIRFVPMAGVNQSVAITNPEEIGSFDNLHLNGAAYNEVDRRLSAVIDSFDVVGPGNALLANSDGFTICRPDGTFSSWSTDLSVATTNVAVGSIFRSSYALWTVPMPTGYAIESAPNVSQCQSSVLATWVGVHGVTLGPPTTIQTYMMAAVTQAIPITYRVRADGFWKKV